ncbi:MAG: hypothetical protein K9M51_02800 [Candidatus Gracilibacteria bacterium]|nr:hypothetical protein [Candidatus Gracilibacteria bacterium]
MKKWCTGILVFGAFLATPLALADPIENLTMTKSGSQMILQWEAPPQEDLYETSGYALQWGEVLNNIRNDKPIRFPTLPESRNSHVIRATDFERNTDYFFRVYTFVQEGRDYLLSNGSQILKWRYNSDGTIDTEYLEPNDPVIVVHSTGSDGEAIDFGNLGVIEFDTRAKFTWSLPNLSRSEYDGFKIVISENTDLSDPVAEFKAGHATKQMFVEGLHPETTYSVAGYFYKRRAGEDQLFGKSDTEQFRTVGKFSTRQEQSFERTIRRWSQGGNLGVRKTIGDETETEEPDVSEETETEATPPTTTPRRRTSSQSRYNRLPRPTYTPLRAIPVSDTTTETAPETNAGGSSDSETETPASDAASLRARIAQIQAEIRSLQTELTRLQAQLGEETQTQTRSEEIQTATPVIRPPQQREVRTPKRGNNWLQNLRRTLNN